MECAVTVAEEIRVRGLVQGVGFRPMVWRLARELQLQGDVRNDGSGVLIRVLGRTTQIDELCTRLQTDCPPLARIDAVQRTALETLNDVDGFQIVASEGGRVATGIVPDSATCPACRDEIFDIGDRRFRYAFTNCTHCGPRLSIVRAIPYDRANTSMSVFPMCEACATEYRDPGDRRFHAQPNACPSCGPRLRLLDRDGNDLAAGTIEDLIAVVNDMLYHGAIVAIKGIGGYHLACDASNASAVTELRQRKRRYHKPFALMARDLDGVRRFCNVDDNEAALLASVAAPVVLLRTHGRQSLPADIAPGQTSLGFMLPYSPLHHLLLAQWEGPLVMTSGNLSDEPQCTHDQDAGDRLQGLVDAFLVHDREIVNRVDDSVARVVLGRPWLLRRARGYAPAPLRLPAGFETAPRVLALGGELKNTVCLLRDGEAIISQHLGDLEEAKTALEFQRTVTLYRELFEFTPDVIAVDRHPDYRSTRFGETLAEAEGIPIDAIQHHFAHVASVLADSGRAIDAPPVIGIALDGLGFGSDGHLWGGEFLLADYRDFRRLAHLKSARLPGGSQAMREPWRNTYAHLVEHIGWASYLGDFAGTELAGWLQQQPLPVLDTMLQRGLNAPWSSSCGRLFDAIAAALGVCRAEATYEGQAAIELEALAERHVGDPGVYPFDVLESTDGAPWQLDPRPLWRELLEDVVRGVDAACIAARFHQGLACAVADLGVRLARIHGCDSVALSGGVMQNRLLFEALTARLTHAGLQVLSHSLVPANDGGLALGQAVIAAARAMAGQGPEATYRNAACHAAGEANDA